jgi:transposase
MPGNFWWDQLTDLRRRGVAVVQDEESPAAVAKISGAGTSTVFGCLARCRQAGWDAHRAGSCGGRRLKMDAVKMR